MTARHAFTFAANPVGDVYDSLLAAGLEAGAEFCVMMQPRKNFSARCLAILEGLRPHLLRTEEVSAWPGSELHRGYSSTRHVYAVNDESVGLVREAADALFDWVNPDLPEDPHILRADGTTWLGSTTQEVDAWLELTDSEWTALVAEWPLLAAALRPDPAPG